MKRLRFSLEREQRFKCSFFSSPRVRPASGSESHGKSSSENIRQWHSQFQDLINNFGVATTKIKVVKLVNARVHGDYFNFGYH